MIDPEQIRDDRRSQRGRSIPATVLVDSGAHLLAELADGASLADAAARAGLTETEARRRIDADLASRGRPSLAELEAHVAHGRARWFARRAARTATLPRQETTA